MTVSADLSRPRALIRTYDSLWRAGKFLGLPPLSTDPDLLMEKSERATGLSDWGTREFVPALRSVIDSLDGGEGMTPFGRTALRQILLRSLNNKLGLVNCLQQDPELEQVPVERPIFIVGWYRSGTTLLHRLLADLPGFRAPTAWELHYPIPGPGNPEADRRRRIRKTDRLLWLARQAVPHLDDVHTLRAGSAEESTLLLDNELCAVYTIHAFGAHDHATWLAQRDLHYAYTSVKRQLQLLSRDQGPQRWVFKCPFSMWHVETLLDVFPDASIICTHRDVRESLPSVCSLSGILQAGFLDEVDPHELGRFWSAFYLQSLQRTRQARINRPGTVFLDVNYRHLIADPNRTARWLQEQLELEEDPTLSLPVRSTQGKRPYRSAHTYTLAQFGLDADDLVERFSPLLEPLPGSRRLPAPKARPGA